MLACGRNDRSTAESVPRTLEPRCLRPTHWLWIYIPYQIRAPTSGPVCYSQTPDTASILNLSPTPRFLMLLPHTFRTCPPWDKWIISGIHPRWLLFADVGQVCFRRYNTTSLRGTYLENGVKFRRLLSAQQHHAAPCLHHAISPSSLRMLILLMLVFSSRLGRCLT